MRIELLYMSAEKLLYYLGTYESWETPLILTWAPYFVTTPNPRFGTDVPHWFVRRGASTVQLILSEADHPITEVV